MIKKSMLINTRKENKMNKYEGNVYLQGMPYSIKGDCALNTLTCSTKWMICNANLCPGVCGFN